MTRLIKIRREKGDGDKWFFPGGVESARAWNNFCKQRRGRAHHLRSHVSQLLLHQLHFPVGIQVYVYSLSLYRSESVVAVNHVLFQYCNLTDYGCMK